MHLTAADYVGGREIAEDLGLVYGNTVRSRFVGRDIIAGFRQMIGGEIYEYTKMLGESREQAKDRMVAQAQALGADAVINVRFTTSAVMQGCAELLAYGTAVKLR